MGAIRDKFFLDRDNAVLVVIDVQDKLCRAMDEKVLEKLTTNIINPSSGCPGVGVADGGN